MSGVVGASPYFRLMGWIVDTVAMEFSRRILYHELEGFFADGKKGKKGGKEGFFFFIKSEGSAGTNGILLKFTVAIVES